MSGVVLRELERTLACLRPSGSPRYAYNHLLMAADEAAGEVWTLAHAALELPKLRRDLVILAIRIAKGEPETDLHPEAVKDLPELLASLTSGLSMLRVLDATIPSDVHALRHLHRAAFLASGDRHTVTRAAIQLPARRKDLVTLAVRLVGEAAMATGCKGSIP